MPLSDLGEDFFDIHDSLRDHLRRTPEFVLLIVCLNEYLIAESE